MCSLEDSSGLFVQTQNSPPGVFFATTSAFLKACEVGRPEEVRSLLLLGADVNWRREDTGWSGLHLSANNNNRDVLDLLLSQPGVNVNISSHRRTTPLMVACFRGHADIVRRLRQVAGADLNCGHTDGCDSGLVGQDRIYLCDFVLHFFNNWFCSDPGSVQCVS